MLYFFSMYVCMYVWSSHVAEYGSTGQGCQSCSWSAEQGKRIFSCPRACLRIWSRETGSAVPSRVSLLICYEPLERTAAVPFGTFRRHPLDIARPLWQYPSICSPAPPLWQHLSVRSGDILSILHYICGSTLQYRTDHRQGTRQDDRTPT